MNRRNFGKTVAGALGAWLLPLETVKAASKIATAVASVVELPLVSEILPVISGRRFFSPLIQRGVIPTGFGYNFTTLLPNKGESIPSEPSNRFPSSALTKVSWQLQQQAIQSADFRAPDEKEEWEQKINRDSTLGNYQQAVLDAWEDKDQDEYRSLCHYKVQCSRAGFNERNGKMPSILKLAHLDEIYTRLVMDGGGQDPIATCDGAPVFVFLTAQVNVRNLVKEWGGWEKTRGDLQWADTPEAKHIQYLFGNSNPTVVAGFVLLANQQGARHKLKGKKLVRIPYFTSGENGMMLVNREYLEAPIHESFVYHPELMKRMMPSDSSPDGSMIWMPAMVPKKDEEGKVIMEKSKWSDEMIPVSEPHPDPKMGKLYSSLMAGWMPIKTQYGYSILHKSCYA